MLGGLNTTGVAPYKMRADRSVEEVEWVLSIGGIEVRTGVPGAENDIPSPIHRLAFGWTDASLRRSKEREDTRRLIERFHSDGVGHLESDLGDNVPAVTGFHNDLANAVPGLDPRRVEEWWTVNLVDELETRRRVEGGQERL